MSKKFKFGAKKFRMPVQCWEDYESRQSGRSSARHERVSTTFIKKSWNKISLKRRPRKMPVAKYSKPKGTATIPRPKSVDEIRDLEWRFVAEVVVDEIKPLGETLSDQEVADHVESIMLKEEDGWAKLESLIPPVPAELPPVPVATLSDALAPLLAQIRSEVAA
tara:strand:+ start:832 stop:1323 length:492 start_codon:yes stop_codon:yes gene_type:complete